MSERAEHFAHEDEPTDPFHDSEYLDGTRTVRIGQRPYDVMIDVGPTLGNFPSEQRGKDFAANSIGELTDDERRKLYPEAFDSEHSVRVAHRIHPEGRAKLPSKLVEKFLMRPRTEVPVDGIHPSLDMPLHTADPADLLAIMEEEGLRDRRIGDPTTHRLVRYMLGRIER